MPKSFQLKFNPSNVDHTFQFANPFYMGYFQLQMTSVLSTSHEKTGDFNWTFYITHHRYPNGDNDNREFFSEIVDALSFSRYRDGRSSHSFHWDNSGFCCTNGESFEASESDYVILEITMDSNHWGDAPVREIMEIDEYSSIQFRY